MVTHALCVAVLVGRVESHVRHYGQKLAAHMEVVPPILPYSIVPAAFDGLRE